jgi:hypothetical protein
MKRLFVYRQIAILAAGLLPALAAAVLAEWRLLAYFGLWTAVWLLLQKGETVAKTADYIPSGYGDYLLALNCLLLAMAAWYEVATGLLLTGMLATIAAWDLSRFYHRLQQVPRLEQAAQLIQTHLNQLLAALLGGLLISLAALFIRYELRFGWGVLLILLLVLAFSRVFHLLGLETWSMVGGRRPREHPSEE